MFSIFHYFHDESKAMWEYQDMHEEASAFIATWKVTCKCGVIRFRKRAYPKPDELSRELHELYDSKPGRIDEMKKSGKYYTFCGHTLESAIHSAKKSKGGNYHI